MRSSRALFIAVVTLPLWLLTVTEASAHRRDEYLQATRIAIEPDHLAIELDLTPGIQVAQNILGEIDRNGDGVMDADEATAYAARVLRDLRLELDDRPLELQLVASEAATLESVLGGEGALRLRMASALPTLSAGVHRVRYRNGHHADVSVYLANALVPESGRVAVQAQHRDEGQSELTIDFALGPASAVTPPLWLLWTVVGGAVLTVLVGVCGPWPKLRETTTRVGAAVPLRHRQPRLASHPMRSRTDRER